ncbi:MAG: guanylate kinase [Lachnospiraceae bacterium]|nr:guanylate kinase [Lachnospiraceae bacterium]
MDQKGLLIVISGFSGAGKGTLVKELVDRYGYSLSISCTTREPRAGEVDGVDYHFKNKEEFERLIDYNGFIEYAQYVENYYGTPRKFVEDEMAAGHNVILEIEVQGAINIKKQYPDAVTMFISAPSAAILRERLVGRGSEDEATINKRMKRAITEADSMPVYDYIVINDDLEDCVNQVQSIIVAESSKSKYKEGFMDEIKDELQSV